MKLLNEFFSTCQGKLNSIPLSFGVELLAPVIREVREILEKSKAEGKSLQTNKK